MKNIMRRTVAFMLMACLLLSVMAPAALAVTVDETAGTYTYTFAYKLTGTAANEYPSSFDFAAAEGGDFSGYARSGSIVKNGAAYMQFRNGTASGSWYALKFNVAKAGYYDIDVKMTTQATAEAQTFDIHFVPVSALTSASGDAANNTAVAGFATHGSASLIKSEATNADCQDVYFETAGDYLIVLETTMALTSVVNFTGMTMTDVTAEVEEMQAFQPAGVDGVYTYAMTVADDDGKGGYPASLTDYYGNFQGYARSTSTAYKVYATYAQLQSGRSAGTWAALKFSVEKAGYYDIDLSMGGSSRTLDVYFVPASTLTSATGDAANNTAVTNLTGGHAVTANEDSTWSLSAVNFASAGEYLIVLKLTGASGNVNFYGMTMTDVTEAAEKRLEEEKNYQPTLDKGVYTYDVVFDADDLTSNGYPANMTSAYYGNFAGYAQSGSIWKPTGGQYIQFQNGRAAGSWVAVKFPVAADGKYDIDITIGGTAATEGTTVDVHILPTSALTAGSGIAANQTAVDNSTGKAVTIGGSDDSRVHEIGAFDLTEGEYLIVIELTSAASGPVNFYDMTLHPYTVEGGSGTMYGKVNTAIGEGETTIKLTTAVSQNITVTNGATLDLNGQTAYGTVSTVDGQIVDNAGNGGVVGTLDATGNTWLPLYDGTAYRFFEYTTKSVYKTNTETSALEFWFDVDFTNDAAYTLLADTSVDTGIDLSVALSWSGSANGSKAYALADYSDAVSGWLAGEIDGDDYGMALEVTNVPDGTSVSVTPAVSANGATIAFDAITNG